MSLQPFRQPSPATLKQLVPQWRNSELGWISSGNVLVKIGTYKIMTWEWMSRWGMTFGCCGSAVQSGRALLCTDRSCSPAGTCARGWGLRAARNWPLPLSYGQFFGTLGPGWCVSITVVVWQSRLLVWGTSGGMEGRKAEQSHGREPLAQHSMARGD